VHLFIVNIWMIKNILVIIQRSNGDVLFSLTLINALYEFYGGPKIDLLINDDTYPLAKLFPNINNIHQFSYKKKKVNRYRQEKKIITTLFRKYDLSINLTASDRSVIYALLASKNSISAIEKKYKKSWWKRIFLDKYYDFDVNKHILLNNLMPLRLLKIDHRNIQSTPKNSVHILNKVNKKLFDKGIKDFIIFHPSAQYNYKIYPKKLRSKLLESLDTLGIPILITGSKNKIDSMIKEEIPKATNIYNLIGTTSLEEYFALSQLSLAYIGMDTLNMHIAASQNKRIFAIFGSTRLSMWSPWSNTIQQGTKYNKPMQSYDNITIFQSSLPCEVCGQVGCGSNHGKNELPYAIKPEEIFKEVEKWFLKNKK